MDIKDLNKLKELAEKMKKNPLTEEQWNKLNNFHKELIEKHKIEKKSIEMSYEKYIKKFNCIE
jgi:uncharacterized protein YnzC (UPF0291/DUF896 family)